MSHVRDVTGQSSVVIHDKHTAAAQCTRMRQSDLPVPYELLTQTDDDRVSDLPVLYELLTQTDDDRVSDLPVPYELLTQTDDDRVIYLCCMNSSHKPTTE